MNVLIWIVNLPYSFGEITNSYFFGRELAEKGINVYFYKTNEFVENYLSFCAVKFKAIGQDEIKSYHFDLVIFSEYIFLFQAGPVYSPDSINFIKDNFFNKIPIGTLDSINFSNYIELVNDQLIFNDPTKMLNFLPAIFPKKEYFFIIHACPMNYPTKKLKNWPLYFYWARPRLDFDSGLDSQIKKIFSLTDGTKQIFLPISKWQSPFWDENFRSVKNLTQKLGDYITHLFESLNLDIEYTLFFGVPSFEFKSYRHKNFSAFYFNPDSGSYLSQPLYDQFLARTDFILTFLFIQNSFIRAVHSGIRGINLTHNVSSVDKVTLPPDFFLNKVILNNFYIIDFNNPDITTNPYFTLFDNFELLDKQFLISLKQIILSNKPLADEKKFQLYLQGLENCLKAGEIVKEMVLI